MIGPKTPTVSVSQKSSLLASVVLLGPHPTELTIAANDRRRTTTLYINDAVERTLTNVFTNCAEHFSLSTGLDEMPRLSYRVTVHPVRIDVTLFRQGVLLPSYYGTATARALIVIDRGSAIPDTIQIRGFGGSDQGSVLAGQQVVAQGAVSLALQNFADNLCSSMEAIKLRLQGIDPGSIIPEGRSPFR